MQIQNYFLKIYYQECSTNLLYLLNDLDMSSETIFKKCDSKIFLQSKLELETTTNIEEKDKDIDEEKTEESVVEFSSAKLDFNDDFEPEQNSLVNNKDFESADGCPTIPNKIFSGTKNVLKIIGWINEGFTQILFGI